MENVVLVVVVPLVEERGKGEGGGVLKTAQIFNQHALIKILGLKYYPILNSLTFRENS